MKLSSTFLGAIAVAQADDHPDLFGTCVKDEKTDRVLPIYFGEANSVQECLAGCRSLNFPYAGLEFKTECYCGDEPEDGFDSLYTWPDRCNMRCGGEGAIWQNCGGAGAMNTWSVPPAVLDGFCVYDAPRDGRVFNGPAEMQVPDMTVAKCKTYCFDQDYEYYGLEYGDSCYCGNNADHLVPALPQECNTPCSGNGDGETATCGSAYRLSAYGPSFYHIKANDIVFEHATVHKWFAVNIDLKLDDNTLNTEKANIYGLMTEGSTYPNVGSQIPAVFIKPSSMDLEVCMYLNGESVCEDLYTAAANTWFNLKIEQTCWIECFVTAYVNDALVFYWWNGTPETFYDVDGVIGNTYKQDDFVAASGEYYDFTLNQYEDGSSETWLTTADHAAGQAGAANA